MKVVQINYEYESREDALLRIVALGDIHRGNPWLDEKCLYKTIDWIQEHDCMVVLMGDYGEAINAKDRRHDYNALDLKYLTPDKQYRKVLDDLEPIKDKIICMLDGNHDYNFFRNHNHNYVDWLATDLGVNYTGVSAYIRVNFRRKTGKKHACRTLNLFAHHGWSGGRTDGYQVKVIHDLAQIFPMCHAYLMGHNHRLGEALPKTHLYVDKRGKIRDFVEKFYFTGSFIKGYEEGIGSYVEARAYRPTMLGSPVIEVKPNRTDTRRRDGAPPPFSMRYSTLDWL